MGSYEQAFKGLNDAQKQAVTTTEGPVLVIAGPGTGKTQLLTTRIAHILATTDTLPQNILCMTFTESGAENMRERLTRFIGRDAYSVNIGTYHAFGGDLIRRFPEAFSETRLQEPVDELAKRQILRTIVDNLSYTNPMKQVRHHIGDLIGTISEVKRALLDSETLRAIARENSTFIAHANKEVLAVFGEIAKMPGTAAKSIPLFEELLIGLQKFLPEQPVHAQFGSLAGVATGELVAALEKANELNKSTPLTTWKSKWLVKDADNRFICSGSLENARIEALASVFEQYQAALQEHGWYDFDDMILRAIEALEKNDDLRYTLQEQYLYILLDEFQDTNAAQLRLTQLLSDNPVSEGRPNVLAVGDDDQAIYAFQGAQYSNMVDFYTMYRDVLVINLRENYRSTAGILSTARGISAQIEARLETRFEGLDKSLAAANSKLPASDIERREFRSDVAQYDWIASDIERRIADGVSPSDIAVLAPKHRQLEPLVPYLAERGVPMRYEKRENILEAPVIRQLLTMSRLILALAAHDDGQADALWPEVLSYDFWHIPVSELWQLSWEVSDTRRDSGATWSKALLASGKSHFTHPALLMLRLATQAETETCEQMLDYLLGTDAVTTHEADGDATVRSPLREFYTGQEVQHTNPELFYDTISHLTVLRARLRDYAASQPEALTLKDLLAFVGMYEEAEERMLNTSPYNQQADAVQLMTVFKAKGLEFAHVYLPSCQDEVWGGSSRGNSNKLTLPPNLAPIRHAGGSDDERLRILFVAVTRARFGLHLTSFARTYSGKDTKHLKYLDEQQQEDGSFKSMVLPAEASAVIRSDHDAPTLDSLELNWRSRHTEARGSAELKGLLSERLAHYQLSPTHLTRFIDLEYGGPEQFFFDALLRFPQAPSLFSQFGDAIHTTLEWVQHRVSATGSTPNTTSVTARFAAELAKCKLTRAQYQLELERGEHALTAFMHQRGMAFRPEGRAEHNFRREGVFVGDVHMSGKVDRIDVDHEHKTITVTDYKTGKSYANWSNSEAKLHKYSLQLYCYKLLIEGSHTFKGYTVDKGCLAFVEPDKDGRVHHLELTFQEAELERVRQLLQAMWQRVLALDLPDTTGYDPTLAGMKAFEADLIAGLTESPAAQPTAETPLKTEQPSLF